MTFGIVAFFIFTTMKKLALAAICTFCFLFSFAQPPSVASLQKTAQEFIRQGDYANAVIILNRSIEQNPENISLQKDLSMCYFYQKDYDKALQTIKASLDNPAADDQCYQIAGTIYKQLKQAKEGEKLYKKGLKKFPNSGPLYNELGELLWVQQNYDAVKYWEEGIQKEPSYSKNYYNAARYYFLTTDKVWSILYGEIFLNMEPNSPYSPEMKQILLDSYKKLFADADLEQANKDKNSFVQAYLKTLNKQSSLARQGLNAESLTMIRTRFILDWSNEKLNEKYPFKLFAYQQNLLKEGLFDAYNQWIFGASQNLTGYQQWLSVHQKENQVFQHFQNQRIFKIDAGEYYK